MTFIEFPSRAGRAQERAHQAARTRRISRRCAGPGGSTAEALDMLIEHVRPGVTTKALDDLVFDFAMAHGAYPAPLDYRGYRKSICTSINHVVCHGIPDDKALREGDIVNIDVTFILDGWHGDASRMFGVGEIPRRAQRLIDVTYEVAAARHSGGQARRDHRRHRRGDPDLRRGRALFDRARFLRARARPAVPRRAEYSALRPERPRRSAARRHVLHDRADGQSRASAGQDIVGRLDRGDARPLALGAIRTFGRRDRNRRRDIHPVAARVATIPPRRRRPPLHEPRARQAKRQARGGPGTERGGDAAFSRPPPTPARPLHGGRRRGAGRLRTVGTVAVSRHSAPRRKTSGQGVDRPLRLL